MKLPSIFSSLAVRKNIKVGWVGISEILPSATLYPLEPFYYTFDPMASAVDMLRCPAIKKYIENMYLVRSPMDFTLKKKEDGGFDIKSTVSQMDSYLMNVLKPSGRHTGLPVAQLAMGFGIVCDDEDTLVESMPLPLDGRDVSWRCIPGSFDPYLWPARPVNFAFEWVNQAVPVVIKRGDPLFVLRFWNPRSTRFSLRPCQMTREVENCYKDIRAITAMGFKGTAQMMKNYKVRRPKKLLKWFD